MPSNVSKGDELECTKKSTTSEKTLIGCEDKQKKYEYNMTRYGIKAETGKCEVIEETKKTGFENVTCCINADCAGGECKNYACQKKEIDTTYNCSKVCKSDEFCNDTGNCEKVDIKNKNYCGNFLCEANETADGKAMSFDKGITKETCFFDCSSPCNSEYCNDNVEIQCGCSEYNVLASRHGCIKNALPCNDCGAQEQLFPELLEIQTGIYDCLVDYFKFKPPKIIYKVFYNPNLEQCSQKEGCEGIEGGAGGADYVMFHNLDGFREYGEVTPTKPEHLTADVHETAHYFLYQMLHGIPSWFHEAVAIQTNERLVCSNKQASWGDSYLPENEGQGGINMDDGTLLNENYYERLRNGQTSLSADEQENPHILGTLFVIGLKKDYDCGFYCIRDIVLKLHEYELKGCAEGKCGVETYNGEKYWAMWLGGEGKNATSNKIEQVTSKVVGKNVSPLFNLLKLHETEH